MHDLWEYFLSPLVFLATLSRRNEGKTKSNNIWASDHAGSFKGEEVAHALNRFSS
jgi:hypothetical protein